MTAVHSANVDANPIPAEERCVPWKLLAGRTTTVAVKNLKIPSKARREYEKACDASYKNKFDEAEHHARTAIDKFHDYFAAWVILGVILEEEHKAQEAGDACSHAAEIDLTYLPAYLCAAEVSVRNQAWEQALNSAELALNLKVEPDPYAYYYRAMAYLHLNHPIEAEKSALQALELDMHHDEPSFYLLLAEIYDREGDKANASAQLQEFLKHPTNRQQEDAAKKLLASESVETGELKVRMPVRRVNSDGWFPTDVDGDVPQLTPGTTCPINDVLLGAGKRVQELVENVDKFTASEVVEHQSVDKSGKLRPPETRQFNYLVSMEQTPSGYLNVEEYRNGGSGPDQFPDHIATVGTPSLVLIFHPNHAKDFQMTCEGLGQWEGRPAWQVRFEEHADRHNSISTLVMSGRAFGLRLRGRAWILADSYQVARLESDLAEEIPEIGLRLQHEDIEYRPVQFGNKLEIWLPSTCKFYMDFLSHRFYRLHRFSDFQLFSVDVSQKTLNPTN